jgi:hypothetical protein
MTALNKVYKIEVKAESDHLARSVIVRQYPDAEIYFVRPLPDSKWLVVLELKPKAMTA